MNCESDPKALHERRRDSYKMADQRRNDLIDADTNLIYAHLTEKRPCPVCQSEESSTVFTKNGGCYVRCSTCTMIYLNPVLKDWKLQEYYRNNGISQAESHSLESEFYQSIYLRGLARVEQFVRKGSILDVGCSGGFFLDIAKGRGWETYGIELNLAEFRIAKQKGHVVWNLPLSEVDFDRKFDVITMWDVFEHIKNGQALLKSLENLLKVGGVIFLQVPNATALAPRILQERCNMFDGVEHVNLYSPTTLKRIAKRGNFEVLHMETVIDELKVIKQYLGYKDPYFGDFLDLEDPSLSFLTSDLIHRLQLGYKIQCVLHPASSVE